MKLPGRDYPIGGLTAEDLDLESARLVRSLRTMRTPMGGDRRAFDRYRRRRGLAAYGALMCRVAARHMRKHDARVYAELTERQQRKVVEVTDRLAARPDRAEQVITDPNPDS